VSDLTPEAPPALGLVWERDRGSLPYALIHGEPLVRCAVLALEAAGIEPIDPDAPWSAIAERAAAVGDALVLHDALCPMTPPDFLAACVTRAVLNDRVVVASRPVTDTVKELVVGQVGRTVDRDRLRAVVSPMVLPLRVVEAFDRTPPTEFIALCRALVERGEHLEWIEAPPSARRVSSAEDLQLLEALTAAPRP
jgi:2-C-methyl-D-erythritol 4-phosphate cytidylyltransferase